VRYNTPVLDGCEAGWWCLDSSCGVGVSAGTFFFGIDAKTSARPCFGIDAKTRARRYSHTNQVALTNEVYMRVAPALCRKPTVDSTQMDWDQVVGTQTSYGLEVEGLGFPDRLYGPHSLPFGGHRGSLLGLKRPGTNVDDSPPSSYGVKN
jgi:hypothetical protein